MSWADAPVAGRRPCRWSSPIAGTYRMTPPRSAVAVSPSAPGLAPLTGFSRSGSPSSLCWLTTAGEVPLRSPVDLARVLWLSDVDTRWTTGVSSVSEQAGQSPSSSAAAGPSTNARSGFFMSSSDEAGCPRHQGDIRRDLDIVPAPSLGAARRAVAFHGTRSEFRPVRLRRGGGLTELHGTPTRRSIPHHRPKGPERRGGR